MAGEFIIECTGCGKRVKITSKQYKGEIEIKGAFDGTSDVLLKCNKCGNRMEL